MAWLDLREGIAELFGEIEDERQYRDHAALETLARRKLATKQRDNERRRYLLRVSPERRESARESDRRYKAKVRSDPERLAHHRKTEREYRIAYRRDRMTDPAYREAILARDREYSRKRKQRIKSDPQQHAAFLERRREYARKKREAKKQ